MSQALDGYDEDSGPGELPATAYAVLGILIVNDEELSAGEIKTRASFGMRYFYWSPAVSHIRRELRRLLALGLVMAGCGSSSNNPNSNNINGTWTANLADTNNTTAFAFSTNFTQGNGNNVTVTNFTLNSPSPCFPSTTTETGTFGLGGNFNGTVTGTFGMTVTTMNASSNNVLTLQGTVNGKMITGTWTLTGFAGCTGNGTFTIVQPSSAA